MRESAMPLANPRIILKEEFDGWGVLFDPKTGLGWGLDPVGVFYWKRLDGRHTRRQLLEELAAVCDDVPDDAPAHLEEFLQDLVLKGFVTFGSATSPDGPDSPAASQG